MSDIAVLPSLSLSHHLCNGLRAGPALVSAVSRGVAGTLRNSASTSWRNLHHPHQAFAEGGQAGTHHVQPQASLIAQERNLSRAFTHLTGFISFRPSGCLTRKHSLKETPPPCGAQEYFRDGWSGERAVVTAVRGGVGTAGLPGEGRECEGWGRRGHGLRGCFATRQVKGLRSLFTSGLGVGLACRKRGDRRLATLVRAPPLPLLAAPPGRALSRSGTPAARPRGTTVGTRVLECIYVSTVRRLSHFSTHLDLSPPTMKTHLHQNSWKASTNSLCLACV